MNATNYITINWGCTYLSGLEAGSCLLPWSAGSIPIYMPVYTRNTVGRESSVKKKNVNNTKRQQSYAIREKIKMNRQEVLYIAHNQMVDTMPYPVMMRVLRVQLYCLRSSHSCCVSLHRKITKLPLYLLFAHRSKDSLRIPVMCALCIDQTEITKCQM